MSELGKTPGKDREQGKATFPAAVGVEASRFEAARLVGESDAAIASSAFAGNTGAAVLSSLGAFLLARRS